MRLVIFGGTTEGRRLSRLLAEQGAEVTVCVATEYGREEQGTYPGVTVLTGRRNREEMASLLTGAALCVDATHPYAVEATENIRAACELAGIPYRRLLREKSGTEKDCVLSDSGNPSQSGGIVTVANAKEAAAYLAATSGRILLATGAKELLCYGGLDPLRLYPRILPTHAGLSACEALGIPHRNILAMQGPFSRELNEALIRQYGISYLVTKDGGTIGGFPEKVQAARNTGAALVLLRRPEEQGSSYAEIAAECTAWIQRTKGREGRQKTMPVTGEAEVIPVKGNAKGEAKTMPVMRETAVMPVMLVGLGCGSWNTVTREEAAALEAAEVVMGAARLLDSLPDSVGGVRLPEVRPGELLVQIQKRLPGRVCVLYSGDTGFYSGARLLLPLLREHGIAYRVLPGISSVQVLAARLGQPWQDWALYSAHGTRCDPVTAVSQGKPAFFLTGTDSRTSPAALCGQLVRAGLGSLPVTVGECLGDTEERITRTTAEAAARETFSPLSVLLAEAAGTPYPVRTPGIPDDAFQRGEVPMTKQEVRAAVLSKLAVRPSYTVWDVGAGTGSVSVELARAAYRGRVFAVERDEAAQTLILRNREQFGAWNLALVPGHAPEALDALPPPDAVFLGGTGGELRGILDTVLTKNPFVRLCISAIALETLSAAVTACAALGLDTEVTQVSVSRTKAAGTLHLLTAQNPVFLITATGGGTAQGSEASKSGGTVKSGEASKGDGASKGSGTAKSGEVSKGGGASKKGGTSKGGGAL